jgi:hypothetical protein
MAVAKKMRLYLHNLFFTRDAKTAITVGSIINGTEYGFIFIVAANVLKEPRALRFNLIAERSSRRLT